MKDAVIGFRRLDAEDRVVRAVFAVVTEGIALADPPAVVSSASIISDCCLCAAFACCSARRCRRAHLDSYAASASAGVRSALMNIGLLVRTKLFSDCLSDLAFLIKNDASSAEDSPTSIGLFVYDQPCPSVCSISLLHVFQIRHKSFRSPRPSHHDNRCSSSQR